MQAAGDVWAVSHQLPQQSGPIIFDHQNDRPLIKPVMPRRHPAMWVAGLSRVRRVERRFEAVRIQLGQFSLVYEIVERGQHDLGCERQRRHYGPRCDGSVVGSVRHAASYVIEELALNAIHFDSDGAGAVACGNSPAMAAIALELEWVVDRVPLLHICCTATVLEIVDAFIAHESVLNTAKVDPNMRELVREQWPG